LKGFSGGKQGISIDVPEDAGQGASVTCGGTLTLNLKAAKAEKKKPAPKKTTTMKKKKEESEEEGDEEDGQFCVFLLSFLVDLVPFGLLELCS
jgi:hypothetical protein